MLILGTGFKTHGFVAPMEVAGRGGRTLDEAWAGVPKAYLGITVPGFPNMFLLYGPNTNGGAGSVIYTVEAATRHVIAALRELERANARTIELRPQAAADFDRDLRAGACRHGLAHRLHQLVRGRERGEPEPVAVGLEHLSPPHGEGGSGRVRAGLARDDPAHQEEAHRGDDRGDHGYPEADHARDGQHEAHDGDHAGHAAGHDEPEGTLLARASGGRSA